MQNSGVEVTEIKRDQLENPEKVELLGNFLFGLTVEMFKARAKNIFHLKWEGNKVPTGTVVNETEIGFTQHGIVRGRKGEFIGTYKRLVEYGGESGKEHQMLIFVN